MTKYLVSGYIGFDNFGDEAIAKVLTDFLKQIGAEKITLLSSNPRKTSELYGVESKYFLNFFKSILETDVLISGGGSLLQDVTSLKSLIYYLAVIVTALVFNKKVVIFAQGFTPFRTKIGKILTSFVLKYCHKIHVRDIKSKELLESLNVQSELVSDPVFGIEIPKVEHSGVGVQLRNFPEISEDFLQNLADKIALKFVGQKIKLISLQDSIDLGILEKFSKILSDKKIESYIVKNLSINDAIKEISSLEYLIGMRFHANLVAVKSGVKVLGINYDIKVSSLAETVGFPLINFSQDDFEKEFNDFIELNVFEYKIPEFRFSEI